jgi:hypothetical protein
MDINDEKWLGKDEVSELVGCASEVLNGLNRLIY